MVLRVAGRSLPADPVGERHPQADEQPAMRPLANLGQMDRAPIVIDCVSICWDGFSINYKQEYPWHERRAGRLDKRLTMGVCRLLSDLKVDETTSEAVDD